MSDVVDEQALARLREVVAAGAEIEQRDADANVLYRGPLARENVELITLPDDVVQVVLRPLQCPDDPDAVAWSPEANRDRPLSAVRFDLIGDDVVGVAQDTGIYSVVRPVSTVEWRGCIEAWERALADGRIG